jgi:hypothetical protein
MPAQWSTVEQVQIIDLENATYLPQRKCIKGMLPTNDHWRSPEPQFNGELSKPTDILVSASIALLATVINSDTA